MSTYLACVICSYTIRQTCAIWRSFLSANKLLLSIWSPIRHTNCVSLYLHYLACVRGFLSWTRMCGVENWRDDARPPYVANGCRRLCTPDTIMKFWWWIKYCTSGSVASNMFMFRQESWCNFDERNVVTLSVGLHEHVCVLRTNINDEMIKLGNVNANIQTVFSHNFR